MESSSRGCFLSSLYADTENLLKVWAERIKGLNADSIKSPDWVNFYQFGLKL